MLYSAAKRRPEKVDEFLAEAAALIDGRNVPKAMGIMEALITHYDCDFNAIRLIFSNRREVFCGFVPSSEEDFMKTCL